MTVYVIVTPKEGEKFTEFYVLGPGGMAEAKTTMKGELTISPDAFNSLAKLKEELEDVIETIEIMNEKQKRSFTKKCLRYQPQKLSARI
jgi:uncharacterized membrane protein